MTAPAVSVIVCSRNRADSLGRVLGAFTSQDPSLSDVEVLAVDNGSTDHTRSVVDEIARRVPGRFRYLSEPRTGKTFALNTGVAEARAEVLCFTDDDVTVAPEWLSAFRDTFKETDCLGGAGRILPRFEHGPPAWLPAGFPFPFQYDFGMEPRDAPAPAFGANMAYRRRAFTQYGGFREDLGPSPANPFGLGEDSEFCARLLKAGERIRYVPKALVTHPVTRAQATRQFLRSWHVRLGRAAVRREPLPSGTPRWFGAPRYLYRELAAATWAWVTSSDAARRLSSSLVVSRLWGQVLEYRAQRDPGPHGSAR